MAFSRKEIQEAQAKKLAAMSANPPGPDLTDEERRQIYEEEKSRREQTELNEEDRQWVYEEERAEEEDLAGQEGENKETKPQTLIAAGIVLCVILWSLVQPDKIMILSSFLSLLCILAFFVGVINSAWVMWWKPKHKVNRLQSSLTYFAVGWAFVIIGIIAVPESVSQEMEQARLVKQKQEQLKKQREAAERAEQEAERKRKKEAELAACKQDLQCWGDQHIATAGFVCDDSIAQLAKYSHKWTDGIFEPKFSRFRWKQRPDVITFLGDKIQFQNGFGAWQHHVYECDVNTETNKALAVRARPGRLGG